jgi:hypothetical protein
MQVPPKGDPQRPIELAIRSTRLLGVASTAFGLVMVFAFGYFNRFQHFRKYFIGMGMLVWFIPGVLFLTASWFIRRRSRAGVITALATAGVQGLFAIAIFAGTLTLEPVSPIPVLVSALWAVALGQLLVHLWKSLESVRLDTGHVRGFDAVAAHLPAARAAQPLRVLPLEVDVPPSEVDSQIEPVGSETPADDLPDRQ